MNLVEKINTEEIKIKIISNIKSAAKRDMQCFGLEARK